MTPHRLAAAIGLLGLGHEVVGQPRERVEPDHARRVGDEVGERVDVVVDVPAGSRVDQVLDASHVDAGGGHDALHLGDDLGGRRVALHAQAVLRRVRGAGGALQLFAVHALADVGRAEVEALARGVDADRVEILSAERLDAHDALVPGRQELLDERGVVQSEVERVFVHGRLERLDAVEAAHAGAAAADVGLHHDREAEPRGRRGGLPWIVDHARAREREPQRVEQRQLARLRDLGEERARAVHHAHAVALELVQVLGRVEDAMPDAAPPRGRAHAVEEQRVRRPGRAGLVAVAGRVEPGVGHTAKLQLGEQRPEPVGMLVVDGDRTVGMYGHDGLPFE